jgi:hypothetical protein
MVRLSCPCGYPIWLSARWTGEEILLVLHDGQRLPTREEPSLYTCPQCRRTLVPADLNERPTSPRYPPPD